MPLDPGTDPVRETGTDPGTRPVLAWTPNPAAAPLAAWSAEPEGYLVAVEGDVRVHFLDWGGPVEPRPDEPRRDAPGPDAPCVLLLPGFLQPAWTWTPVARRLLACRRTVVADLRGQGLSDAPPGGYDVATLAADAVAVAEGSGLLDTGRIVVAGHGFAGAVAAAAAELLADRCAGLVLVDGGWDRAAETTGLDADEFLRALDEPPEVMRTMASFLVDRRGFDPASWDADQERAARDGVVETAAGHVLRAVRPHVIEALVRSMFEHDPAPTLAVVDAPVTVLLALGAGDTGVRLAELERAGRARVQAGRPSIRAAVLPDAHNLMRYRPADVAAAVLEAHR